MPYTYSRQRIGQIVRQISGKAGITKRVYPHLLHYTMATKLWWLVMDITDVQRFLGHENIETTRHYAGTTAATLRRKFDQITDPAAQALFWASGTLAVMMPPFWGPTCFRKIRSPGPSHLLVHEDQMFALPQAIIHFPPLERLAQQSSSAFDPKEQFLQFPSAVRIIEHRKGPGVADFRDDSNAVARSSWRSGPSASSLCHIQAPGPPQSSGGQLLSPPVHAG